MRKLGEVRSATSRDVPGKVSGMEKLLTVAMAYVKRGRRKRCGEKHTGHTVVASTMEYA